jgi:hypothetical protein
MPSGIRHGGGAKLNQALVRNVRTYTAMPREKAQAAPTARPKVTDAPVRGGLPRSSVEAGIMPTERREQVIAIGSGQPAKG